MVYIPVIRKKHLKQKFSYNTDPIWDGINKIIDVICKICFQVILNASIPGSVGIIYKCIMPYIFLQCKKSNFQKWFHGKSIFTVEYAGFLLA